MAIGISYQSVKSWWTELLYNLHYSESAVVPKIISQTKAVLRGSGLRLGEPKKKRAMSFVGLIKPIQQAMSVCGITPAASVDYSQDECHKLCSGIPKDQLS